jgi:hypothetical protein
LIGLVEAVLLELAGVLAPVGMVCVEGVRAVGKGACVVDAAPSAAAKAGIGAAVGETTIAEA